MNHPILVFLQSGYVMVGERHHNNILNDHMIQKSDLQIRLSNHSSKKRLALVAVAEGYK